MASTVCISRCLVLKKLVEILKKQLIVTVFAIQCIKDFFFSSDNIPSVDVSLAELLRHVIEKPHKKACYLSLRIA